MTRSRNQPAPRAARPHPALHAVAFLFTALLAWPMLIPMLPVLYFDVDPRSDIGRAAITQFGPTATGVYHTALIAVGLVAAAFVQFTPSVMPSRHSGWICRASAWLPLGVLLGAAGVIVYWLLRDPDHGFHLSGWLAGLAVGLGAFQLGRTAVGRRWLFAALLAVAVPMALEAVEDVTLTYAAQKAHWDANKQAIFASRGMEPDSASAQLLERRTLSRDATGALGLANVLGTFAAGLTVLAWTLAAGLLIRTTNTTRDVPPFASDPRTPDHHAENASSPAIVDGRRLNSACIAALVAIGLLALVTVWVTNSRGALAVTLAGLGTAGALFVLMKLPWLSGQNGQARGALAAVGVTLLPLALTGAILMVGASPPSPGQTLPGWELSLLVRAHYLQGAASILGDWHWHPLTGAGLDGFKQAYLIHKSPIAVEEVASTHHAPMDALVMLGLPGLLLAVLVYSGLARSAWRLMRSAGSLDRSSLKDPGLSSRAAFYAALGFAALVAGPQFLVQQAEYDAIVALRWMLGVAGMVTALVLVLRLPNWPAHRWSGLAMLAGGVTVWLQGHLDMAFYQGASAPLVSAWMGLACAAGWPLLNFDAEAMDESVAKPSGWRWAWPVAALLCIAVSGVVILTQVRTPLAVKQAAWMLQQGRAPIEAAVQLETVRQPTSTIVRKSVELRLEQAAGLHRFGQGSEARALVNESLAIMQGSAELGYDTSSTRRLTADIHRIRRVTLGQAEAIHDEIAAREAVLETTPDSLPDLLRLADLLHDAGRVDEARPYDERALERDRLLWLDPAKQLTEPERNRVQSRVEG